MGQRTGFYRFHKLMPEERAVKTTRVDSAVSTNDWYSPKTKDWIQLFPQTVVKVDIRRKFKTGFCCQRKLFGVVVDIAH